MSAGSTAVPGATLPYGAVQDRRVHAVQDRRVQDRVGRGRPRMKVVRDARTEEGRDGRGVAERERDGRFDQRHPGVLRRVGEGFGHLQLALVDRRGHVEAAGRCRAGGRLGVPAPAARQPPSRERAVGDHPVP
ncbi:hypothetical protein GCM10010421_08660 [Streptomyces glaucus]|uniref:Secreted protein n=1 Tax=Streptomyces glaucus TaxID=284029 RepID=A0ABN3JAF0_9ACTN